MKDQVCDGRAHASENSTEFEQAHEASSGRIRVSRV